MTLDKTKQLIVNYRLPLLLLAVWVLLYGPPAVRKRKKCQK